MWLLQTWACSQLLHQRGSVIARLIRNCPERGGDLYCFEWGWPDRHEWQVGRQERRLGQLGLEESLKKEEINEFNKYCRTLCIWILSQFSRTLNVVHVRMLSHFSCAWLFATLWTIARQAPLSMWFSRQKHWSRLPFPSPGYLPNPEIDPAFLMSPALAGVFFTAEPLGKPLNVDWDSI